MEGDAARWAAILQVVAQEIDQRGEQGWLVGGCLRDAILGLPVRDVDIAVTGEPLAYAQGLRMRLGAAIAPLNSTTVRLALGDGGVPSGRREIDISTLRGTTIEDDLLLRDFRVNALALPLNAYDEFVALLKQVQQRTRTASDKGHDETDLPTPIHLIDPLNGIDDLRARKLTPASSSALSDDPGRILRAARLTASQGLSPSHELLKAVRTSTPLLQALPRDRVRDEIGALLALRRAWQGLDILAECGALALLLGDAFTPEVLAHGIASIRATDVIEETTDAARTRQHTYEASGVARLRTLDAVRFWCMAPQSDGLPRLVALRWGLLLHALADVDMLTQGRRGEQVAAAQRALERLPLGAHTRTIARAVLECGEWRQRLAERTLDTAELRHFFARFGDAGVDMLIGAVACMDAMGEESGVGIRSTNAVAERVYVALTLFFGERERLVPPPLLNGADLMRVLGVEPGPALKATLHAVRMAQLDGTITSQDEALAFAEQYVHRTYGDG